MPSIPQPRSIIWRVIVAILYVSAGGGIFFLLEKDNDIDSKASNASLSYNETIKYILHRCLLNDSEVTQIIKELRHAFPPKPPPVPRNYANGVVLAMEIVTTIGYGTKVPTTVRGRMFLIFYALVGIPLVILTLNTICQKIGACARGFIVHFEKIILKRENPQQLKGKTVILCCVVTLSFLLVVSLKTTYSEGWDYTTSLYVWFVTFSTIGFGDFVPTIKVSETLLGYIIGSFIYGIICLLGLALVGSIINSFSDWIGNTCIVDKIIENWSTVGSRKQDVVNKVDFQPSA